MNQNTAMEDQNQREKQITVEATDILVKKMNADKVIRNLKAKHAISKKEENYLFQLQGNTAKRSFVSTCQIGHTCSPTTQDCLDKSGSF